MNEPPPLPETRWCSRCGASIQPAANFCHACGVAVPKSVPTPQGVTEKPPRLRPKNRPALAKLLMLGFIVFVVYAVYDANKRQAAQQTSGTTSSPRPQQSNYQIGDNVAVGYMGYKVVGIRWDDQLSKNPYLNKRPISHYLVVEIAVANLDKKARTIPPFHLVDANGAEYDTALNGAYLDDAIGPLDSLNPEVAKRGTIVFDVPKDRTYKLKLSGGYWSRDNAYVELKGITTRE